MSWIRKISDWFNPGGPARVSSPVTRPAYVEPYLEDLAGPDEMHGLGGDCQSPYCNYEFSPEDEATSGGGGSLTCPLCGFENDLNELHKPMGQPGGTTRSGLSLKEMGDIGENVVLRLGELPGVGAITSAGGGYNFPIDAIVEAPQGKFGCEIKTVHSQAQERFKLGGRQERLEKLQHCYENGLKPAIIGVRLNFFTSLAYVFFREGMTDTWIGQDKMMHVGTFNFEDLNPFRSPDPQAQALAVENAHLPDQSEDEFAGVFPPKAADWNEEDHPRDHGKFTFKQDVKELKVVDKSGKHSHNIRRCVHCGHLNAHPSDESGRVQCSTCGEDPDRDLKLSKIVLASREADQVAQQLGFQFFGRTGQGHRKYSMQDENGTDHTIVVGSGAHGKNAAQIDADRARQRMTRCINGACNHITTPALPAVVEGDPFVVRAGQTVSVDGASKFVQEVDGGLALVYDVQTGAEDVVQMAQIQALAAEHGWSLTYPDDPYLWNPHKGPQEPFSRYSTPEGDPDFLFVFYQGELRIEPYHHNRSPKDMFEDLLSEFNMDLQGSWNEISQSDIDVGRVWANGQIEHENLTDPTIKEQAEDALKDWWDEEKDKDWTAEPEEAWQSL